jgi:hexosaminidase
VLTAWAENDARLPAMAELAGLSKNLSVLGLIGLRALEYLQSGQTPPQGWMEQQLAALTKMEKPEAEVRLAAVRPVRILIEGAGRQHSSGGNK